MTRSSAEPACQPIAVVSMAGRFPGAPDVEQFCENILRGRESITRMSAAEYLTAGGDPVWAGDPGFVGAEGVLDDITLFDAAFFGYSPRQAQVMDPQHRVLLETAWHLFDTVGYDPADIDGEVGVFISASPSSYLVRNLLPNAELVESTGGFPLLIHNDKDFAAATVSYQLGLTGPSYAVGSACSSSLVATHVAVQSLRAFECDLALAGGVSLQVPHGRGYVYRSDGVYSPRGRCAPFAASADGTVGSSGAGLVLLKRLSDAQRDGDVVHALILGSAVNNDGSDKVGFAAPSVHGQTRAILEAQAVAGISPDTIGYIEGHGTGTGLGDPIEVEALNAAFRQATDRTGFCALGSVKGNIGHLDAAAGVAGLIKAVLAVRDGLIPASLNYDAPHPEIDFDSTPFYLPTTGRPWPDGTGVRRAGVSSFGIGGTNAHVIVEQPQPAPDRPGAQAADRHVLTLSAMTEQALVEAAENLADHLDKHRDVDLADVAGTLSGRRRLANELNVVCQDPADAVTALRRVPRARSDVDVPSSRPQRPFRRVVLPPYPFQRQRYWVDPPPPAGPGTALALTELTASLRAVITSDTSPVITVDGIPGLRSGLDELGCALVLRYLSDCGVSTEPGRRYTVAEIGGRLGVLPEFARFVEYLLTMLAADGLASRDGGSLTFLPVDRPRPVEELAAELSSTYPGFAGMVELLVHCVGSYPRALSTPGAALDTLYPDGSGGLLHRTLVAGAVEQGSIGRLCRLAVHLARRMATRTSGPLQVLEVGAGAGRLTQALVTGVAPAAMSYCATDISKVFLQQIATQAAAQGMDFVRTEVLDVSRDPLEQGFRAGAYHLVCGLDVVHATPDLPQSLAHLRSLLAPGGVLALIESTAADRWLSLVWGLSAQWWGYTDGLRDNGPLLSAEQWRELVGGSGFAATDVITVGGAGDAALVLAQVPDKQPASGIGHPRWPSKRPDPSRWGYLPGWRHTGPVPAAVADPSAGCLVLANGPLGAVVATQLLRRGVATTLVRRNGAAVCPPADGLAEVTVNPELEQDYRDLIIAAAPDRPVRLVIHLWALEDAVIRGRAAGSSEVAATQLVGLHSLLQLAREFGTVADRKPVRIAAVTVGTQDVLGDDLLHPEHATLNAALKIIPREYPWLSCAGIDLAASEVTKDRLEDVAARIVDELLAARETSLVAYRGRRRFQAQYTEARLNPASEAPRAGGTYLVVGGLGGIGLSLAEYLAALPARVVLTHRREFPTEPEWAQYLADCPVDDPTAVTIQRLMRLTRGGGEVLVVQAELTSPADMRAAIDAAERRFGPIDGVVHAAGVPDGGGVIQRRSRSETDAAIAAKVVGTLVLVEALGDRRLDFLVLCSSIGTVLHKIKFGEVGYLAGNEFLNAFAAARQAVTPGRTVAVAWTDWLETGMWAAAQEQLNRRYAVNPDLPPDEHPSGDLLGGITRQEGVELFSRILGADVGPQVVVSTQDLAVLLERHTTFSTTDHLNAIGGLRVARSAQALPALPTDCVTPMTPTEHVVATWWGDLLGYDEVGIHADFFELGGDSLVALRLLAMVRTRFGVDVSVDTLFTGSTVAALASVIDRSVPATAADRAVEHELGEEVVL